MNNLSLSRLWTGLFIFVTQFIGYQKYIFFGGCILTTSAPLDVSPDRSKWIRWNFGVSSDSIVECAVVPYYSMCLDIERIEMLTLCEVNVGVLHRTPRVHDHFTANRDNFEQFRIMTTAQRLHLSYTQKSFIIDECVSRFWDKKQFTQAFKILTTVAGDRPQSRVARLWSLRACATLL